MQQQTAEWYAARIGRLTGSRISAALSKGEARTTLICEMADEMMVGNTEFFSSAATDWGNQQEPEARNRYQDETGYVVYEEGLTVLKDNSRFACSPDGLVGDDGIIEIKCPFVRKNHIKNVLYNGVKKHMPQIQWNMYVSGRDWCDFISFDKRMPGHSQLYIERIQRDEKYIEEMVDKATLFINELDGAFFRLIGEDE